MVLPYWPSMQLEQTVEVVAPVFVENVPTGQLEHEALPVPILYFPAEQVVHEMLPVPKANDPAEQK
jgi:hypothetical protein